ncbi:MAG: Phosphoribosylamine--glycine ligase, partial [uncultured Rubrobacteraceae bacterium]
ARSRRRQRGARARARRGHHREPHEPGGLRRPRQPRHRGDRGDRGHPGGRPDRASQLREDGGDRPDCRRPGVAPYRGDRGVLLGGGAEDLRALARRRSPRRLKSVRQGGHAPRRRPDRPLRGIRPRGARARLPARAEGVPPGRQGGRDSRREGRHRRHLPRGGRGRGPGGLPGRLRGGGGEGAYRRVPGGPRGLHLRAHRREGHPAVRPRSGLQAPRGRGRGAEHRRDGGLLTDDVDGALHVRADSGGDHQPHHPPARAHRGPLHGPLVRGRHGHRDRPEGPGVQLPLRGPGDAGAPAPARLRPPGALARLHRGRPQEARGHLVDREDRLRRPGLRRLPRVVFGGRRDNRPRRRARPRRCPGVPRRRQGGGWDLLHGRGTRPERRRDRPLHHGGAGPRLRRRRADQVPRHAVPHGYSPGSDGDGRAM